MDYLVQGGERVCAIKILTRTGRVQVGDNPSVSLPKAIGFRCSKRPLPQHFYQVKLRGKGIVPIRITTICGNDSTATFLVDADVMPPVRRAEPSAFRIIARNRRIPGRATGVLFVVLKWPSGGDSLRAYSIQTAMRAFTERLRLVPPEERDSVGAHLDAEVRKARGGFGRRKLASWKGTDSLPEFLQAARSAWRSLPKEYDDQRKTSPVSIDSLLFK